MYAINLLMSLAMSAGTDYGIFFVGRYQEARQAGEDPETAYYTTYRGIAKVVLASGLTIAGAIFCLTFTRMPYFQTMGIPCAVGMLVTTAVALTLVPAVIAVGGRFGLFEPKRRIGVRRWRRVGTAIVRWPVPILAATCALALLGLLTLPGYKTSYNGRLYIPKDVPANLGYAAADRHFPAGANDAGSSDDRVGSRYAQSGGFSRAQQASQESFPGPRNFSGARHNPARGNPDRAHIDTFSDQHAKRDSATKHALYESAHERHAQSRPTRWGK